jgi:cell division septation protein DedD
VISPPIKTDDADEPSITKDDPIPPAAPVKTPEKPKPVESKPKSTPKPPPSETVKTVTKSVEPASGLHLIIAGNFLEKANAEERVRQLQKLGYPLAEVVNFELSEYHTACAGRYSDLNEARRISKKIKEMHGIDTYVRLGN